jgi:uncharacterized protein (TIGR03067 family)
MVHVMRYAVAMLAVVLVAVAAVRGSGPKAPVLRVVPSDLALLQGKWLQLSVAANGKQPKRRPTTWTFDGQRMSVNPPEGIEIIRFPLPDHYRFELDPTTRPPWFTYRNAMGNVSGIYRLKGDMLQICVSWGDRPKGFEDAVTFAMQRVKPPTRPLDRLVVAEP